MRVMFAAVLLLAPQEPASDGEPSLDSLRGVARRLDDGFAAVLKGTKPAEAFKPWKPEAVPIDRTTVLLGQMKSNGMTAARSFALDLHIQLWAGGKGMYQVTAKVHATPEATVLLGLEGKPFDTTALATAIPAAKCIGESEPFKEAAESLLKRLKENRAGVPVFAGDDLAAKRVPKLFQEAILDQLKKSRAAAPRICRAVADAAYDEVRIGLDEQYYSTVGADGAVKEAFVRGKLRLSDSGEVLYRLSRLETE